MIESGSLVPGVDPALFRLPPGTALRLEFPDDALRDQFSGYALLDSDPAIWTGLTSWSLPGHARLWIKLTDAPISVVARNRARALLNEAVLVGPCSRGMPVVSHGGVSIVIDFYPAGWARWIDRPAEQFRDRVLPLDQVWAADRVKDLLARLGTMTRADALKPILDGFFLEHLPPPHRDEEPLRIAQKLVSRGAKTVGTDLAAAMRLKPYALRKLFTDHFGYTPKLVVRRTRFMRALTTMILTGASPDAAEAPVGYHDHSHFLRDAAEFLDTTPRRFLAMPLPYLWAMIRGRAAVITMDHKSRNAAAARGA